MFKCSNTSQNRFFLPSRVHIEFEKAIIDHKFHKIVLRPPLLIHDVMADYLFNFSQNALQKNDMVHKRLWTTTTDWAFWKDPNNNNNNDNNNIIHARHGFPTERLYTGYITYSTISLQPKE